MNERSADMKTIQSILTLLLLFLFISVDAQVIRSEKAFLQVQSKPKEEADVTPPVITMISPKVDNRSLLKSSESKMVMIGKVSDPGGISTLLIDSESLEIAENGVFNRELELQPGENEVVIIALDNNDNITEYKFIVDYLPEKVPLAVKINQESEYYALIIGINNYSDFAIRSLDHAISDAESLFEVLSEEYTFKRENIQFLKDAKREEIIYALDNLSYKVTPYDNLLIFYAGHGYFDENSNIGYWLPSDARKISKADWFRNSTLVDYLKEIDSRHTLLITDACFGGSIFNTRAAFMDAPKAIEKLYELPSRKAMTSGTLTEVPDQSSFAKYLVDRLDVNREKYLSSEQLFSSLRTAVLNNSDAVPQYGEIRNVG
ncbi:MAG: caspase family protein, partial [Bacteroidales bacterium]|nr:caspase family protein [Bacteroidales bacterium]